MEYAVTLQAYPDLTALDRPETVSRPPYGLTPREAIDDTTLSNAAFRMFCMLDARQGRDATSVHVGIQALMVQSGWSARTVRRALDELVAAGRISRRGTWRTNIYEVHNVARQAYRPAASGNGQHVQSAINDPLQSAINDPFIEQEPMSKSKASKDDTRPSLAASTPAAATLIDRQTFMNGTPGNRRPSDTPALTRHLSAAMCNGWTVAGLLEAVRVEITNPHARPGLTMTTLAALAQRPAREYGPAATASTKGQALPQEPQEPLASEATRQASLAAMRTHVSAIADKLALSGH